MTTASQGLPRLSRGNSRRLGVSDHVWSVAESLFLRNPHPKGVAASVPILTGTTKCGCAPCAKIAYSRSAIGCTAWRLTPDRAAIAVNESSADHRAANSQPVSVYPPYSRAGKGPARTCHWPCVLFRAVMATLRQQRKNGQAIQWVAIEQRLDKPRLVGCPCPPNWRNFAGWGVPGVRYASLRSCSFAARIPRVSHVCHPSVTFPF
jgi:hypothetical protein